MTEHQKKSPRTTQTERSGWSRAVPILLYALAAFVALCFFTQNTGLLGRAISNLLFGLFSRAAYAIPPLIVLHGIFYRRDAENRRRLTRFLISAIALLTLSAMMFLGQIFDGTATFSIPTFYAEGKELIGGGAVGSTVAYGLGKIIGPVGLIVLAVLIFSLYLLFFFSNDSGALRKCGYWCLNLLLNLFDWVRTGVKKLFALIGGGREKTQKRKADEKHHELTDDDFFAVDNGMRELSIDELGIRETRDTQTVEREPFLRESVYPKSEVREGDDATRREDAPHREERPHRIFNPDAFYPEDEPIASSAPDARQEAEPDPAQEQPDAADAQTEERADLIFTKDFDPLDLATNEKLANRRSSHAEEVAAKKKTRYAEMGESINDLTPEDVERARRNADFEMKKKALIDRFNAQKEAAKRAAEARESGEETPAVSVREQPAEGRYDGQTEGSGKTLAFRVEEGEAVARPEPERASTVIIKNESAENAEQSPAKARENLLAAYQRQSTYQRVAEFTNNMTSDDAPVRPAPIGVSYVESAIAPIAHDERAASPAEDEAKPKAASGDDFPAPSTWEAEEIDAPTEAEDGGDPIGSDDPDETEDGRIDDATRQTLVVHRAALDPELPDAFDEEDDEDEEDDDDVFTFGRSPEEEEVEPKEEIPQEEWNEKILEQQKLFSIFSASSAAPAGQQPEANGEEVPPAQENEPDETEKGPDTDDGERDEDESDEEDDLPPSIARDTAEQPEKKIKPDYTDYQFPPLSLLSHGKSVDMDKLAEETRENGDILIRTLESFNVKASIKGIDRGPRITRYEVVPASGVRVSAVTGLFNDIALALGAEGIRMEAPIPGKSAIGFEIPNKTPTTVALRDLIESDEFAGMKSKSAVCVGKDVTGNPVFGDIATMPHLLVAGATGMGKSVSINALLISMLYKARPDELKLILIDPKKVEFKVYHGIPHLLVPVVIDPKQTVGALAWANQEMERRYNMIEQLSVRNIDVYNARVSEDPSLGDPMPRIVIVIDELNDLMLKMRDPVENLITSISQKARAAGIHLIIGTQRPSVNVITGTIKANIPSRIACKVTSNVDSRTILDIAGAEQLLDKGDMLFRPVGRTKPLRVQGAFVADNEVEAIMDFLRTQTPEHSYDEQAIEDINRAAQKCIKKNAADSDFEDEDEADGDETTGALNDQKFLDAVEIAINARKISTALLQRKLHIGYGKAAGYIDTMVDLGVVSEPNGQKPRDVLITMDEWHEKLARVSLDD